VAAGQAEVYLPLGDLVDLGAERKRLEREIEQEESLAERARTKLSNEKFTSGAPADVVERTRTQQVEHTERAARLRAQLEDLA
jgi:valyl-tRNA synthetase